MHTAYIAKIDAVREIPGANAVQTAVVLGEDVVVSKDWAVGFVGVFFPVDLQLSKAYASANNLYRKAELNADSTAKPGFFDENGRVRAQPFLKVKSVGFFAKLDSLAFTGADVSKLKVGESFTELNGVELCSKYISPEARKAMASNGGKARKADLFPDFAKHVDSEQFRHLANTIEAGSVLSFHAKVHGTSFRVGRLPKVQQLSGFQKFVNRFFKLYPETVMDDVIGSRNVVLADPNAEGYHGSEAFRYEVAEAIKPYIKDGMTIYGEIAGYANGGTIMPSHATKGLKNKEYDKKYPALMTYSYGCEPGQYRFHIYRITNTTQGGEVVEMPQYELDAWCANRGLNGPLEVAPKMVYDGNVRDLQDYVTQLTDRPEVLTEDYIDPRHISEGIIIRVENKGRVKFFKNKSYAFRVLEGLCEAVDAETVS